MFSAVQDCVCGGVHFLIPSLPLAVRVQRVPCIEVVQQRPGLLPKPFGFLGCKCPAFLQVQLWYLSINLLQILGTAAAVLPSSPEHPRPSALPHPAITVPPGTRGCSSLYICPVFPAHTKASEDKGMEEKEASCPGVVFRQKCACVVHLEAVGVSLWCGEGRHRELGLK